MEDRARPRRRARQPSWAAALPIFCLISASNVTSETRPDTRLGEVFVRKVRAAGRRNIFRKLFFRAALAQGCRARENSPQGLRLELPVGRRGEARDRHRCW